MKKQYFPALAFFCMLIATCSPATCEYATAGKPQVKNVIFMIGDGMGLTHVTAAMLAKGAPLALQQAQYIGLQTTRSASSEVTDSAASGTALATGTKTYNGAIGLDMNKQPLENIREKAEKIGKATGVVATYALTNATPAAFMAHDVDRGNEFEIAEDFLDSGVDLFIGGGKRFFEERKDGRNLSDEMRAKGYTIVYSLDDLQNMANGPVGVLLAPVALPRMSAGRGDMLPQATAKALDILSQNKKGFFVMIEGSQIDGGGHDNKGDEVVNELIDFDNAVKVAMDFADRNPGTLVVITADHETGGMTLPDKDKKAVHKFSTGGHSGTMVPIYSYGTGAEEFAGIMDNTDIPKKMAKLMKAQ